jgi:DNA polymerase-3 subunit delta
MSKSFTKKVNSCEIVFYPPYENEALSILQKEASSRFVTIDTNALTYLYNMHEKDLTLCVNDLDKLAILNRTIDIDIVNTQCFGMGNINLDNFFIKLFSGVNINNDIYKLLEEGLNEIALLNQTISFIQQLFNINSYLKIYGNLNIKEIWGYNLPKNIASTRVSVAKRYTTKQLLDMLDLFLTIELELKTKTTLDSNSYIQSQFRNFSANLR